MNYVSPFHDYKCYNLRYAITSFANKENIPLLLNVNIFNVVNKFFS